VYLTIDRAGVEEHVQQGVVDEAPHFGDGAQGEGLQPNGKEITSYLWDLINWAQKFGECTVLVPVVKNASL
jgi:hypothetical protein